jgi:predicted dehydrogenase
LEPIRIGIVGCGLFGESHLQAFRAIQGIEIAAVFDISTERASALAREFGVPRVAHSLEDLCQDPTLQAVDVITPEETHRIPVLTALRAGKHVFVEKPLATKLDEGLEMIRVSEETGRILMVGQILRFETKYAMLKDELGTGRLGRIISMQAKRNRMRSLLEIYDRTHPALENSIHDIDLMLWYTGDRVRSVRGFERSATGRKHADTFWGVIEFEGGSLGVVETIWLLPSAAGVGLDDSFQLIGDQGVANVSLVPGGLSFWRESGHEIPDVSYDPRVRGTARGALRDELAYFCDCVRMGEPPDIITPREAQNAVRVALALIESAKAGKDIAVTEWD